MSSQDRYAQRTEESADSERSVGDSQARQERTPNRESVNRSQGRGQRFRSKDFRELCQLGAKEFSGATDPAEAETWLKGTERIFTLMGSTEEEQFVFIVSLLQGDAYDWWETIPNATARPPVLTYADFLREFRDKYMPEMY